MKRETKRGGEGKNKSRNNEWRIRGTLDRVNGERMWRFVWRGRGGKGSFQHRREEKRRRGRKVEEMKGYVWLV